MACTWFGEVDSCCCLLLLPQLEYNISATIIHALKDSPMLCGFSGFGQIWKHIDPELIAAQRHWGHMHLAKRPRLERALTYREAQNGLQTRTHTGLARQISPATAGTNFTRPGARHLVLLCKMFEKLSHLPTAYFLKVQEIAHLKHL